MQADYIQHMGSDLTCTNAARVSFDKQSEWEPAEDDDFMVAGAKLSEKDEKLINYLARHNHFTPFTHTAITLRETVPIFVARQRFKHTVGFSYNETSRRYVDDEPEFYTPDVWRTRPGGSIKQGSGGALSGEMNGEAFEHYNEAVEACRVAYLTLLEYGVAPEQARMVLPQSMLTSYYVTGSLAAFARAYSLRSDPHAQQEIQVLASQWDEIIRPLFPVSWAALVEQQ